MTKSPKLPELAPMIVPALCGVTRTMRPRMAKPHAEDLHAALNKADEQGPFVLVGHSMGGPYIMTFTKYFGTEVAGLVFVDATHPETFQRYSITRPLSWKQKMLEKFEITKEKIGAALHWTGIVRILAIYEEKEPNQSEHHDQAIKAYASTSLGAAIKERDAFEQTLAEAGTFRKLGDRPVFVLTAMKPLFSGGHRSLGSNPRTS